MKPSTLYVFEVEYILDDGALENCFAWIFQCFSLCSFLLISFFTFLLPSQYLHLHQNGKSSIGDRHQSGFDWGCGGTCLPPQTPVLSNCGLPHQEQPQHGGKTGCSFIIYFFLKVILLSWNFTTFLSLTSGLDKSAFAYCFVSGIRCCTFRHSC